MSFSARLKQVIEKKNLSQAEAARICGIAQQSMNYILNSNLKSSKLAPQIADALNINPEWLIFGQSRPEIPTANEIPIIHSAYMLKKHITGLLAQETIDFTLIDSFLGNKAFAYLIKPTKMIICSDKSQKFERCEYLSLENDEVSVSQTETIVSFPIFEWRERYGDF